MTDRGATAVAPWVLLLLILGFADSVTASYFVLYATDDLGLAAFPTGVAISLSTLSGILLTTLAGRSVDRRATRVPLLLALVVAAAGNILLALISGFVPVLVAVVLTGAAYVGFPQVFALQRAASPDSTGGSTGKLRAGWSLAWALGPLIAGAIVAVVGYRWLFVVGGALLAVAVAVTALVRFRPVAPAGVAEKEPPSLGRRRSTRLTVLAVALVHLAMFVGSFALPLLVTGPARSDPGWVGVAFGVCAAIEVPAALLAGRLLRTRSTSVLLIASGLVFAAYFAVIAAWPTLVMIIGAQLLRGVALAITGIAGIEALRELMAPRLAAAAAAFANALAVGSLVAGVGAGALVQLMGVRMTMVVAGGLALAAGPLLAAAARMRTR